MAKMKESGNTNVALFVYIHLLYLWTLPNHQGNHTRRGSHRVELMSDCKRASLSQIINLFIPAKYVELGDKADFIWSIKTNSDRHQDNK